MANFHLGNPGNLVKFYGFATSLLLTYETIFQEELTMKITTLKQWAALLELKLPSDHAFTGVSVDSRLVEPGNLFFALKGDKVDGHLYLEEAKIRGAVAAVIADSYNGPSFGLLLIRVENPLIALQNSTKKLLSLRKTRIVAITGSVGKTSTKEFIVSLLKLRYRVGYSPGNSNSQIGLPLSIFNHCQGDEEILVLEMGMTLPGHLKELVQIAPPEVAIITTIALVHACSFHSLEHIAETKAEIFSHPNTRLGIIPYEMPNRSNIEKIGCCSKMTYSKLHSNADYFLDEAANNTIYDPLNHQSIELGTIPIPGKHNRHNVLAAITVARYFNISWEEIARAISSFKLPEKRLQIVERDQILFINDSYNAAEISVKAALDYLSDIPSNGRKIAVLGSMMELGKFSDECHRRVGEYALKKVDRIYCFGVECTPILETWRNADKPVELFLEFEQLIQKLRADLKATDHVLLKGSRSKQLWKILEQI